MKKILLASLFAAGTMAVPFLAHAQATPDVEIDLVDGYNEVIGEGDVSNNPQLVAFTAIDDRAGFVKNNFEITISSNVAIGFVDDQTRAGVIAGSNRGRVVFTGTTLGGSIAQCGDIQTAPDFAAELVQDGNLDLDSANGCGR